MENNDTLEVIQRIPLDKVNYKKLILPKEVEQMRERKPSVLKKLKDAQAAEMPKTTPKQKEAER